MRLRAHHLTRRALALATGLAVAASLGACSISPPIPNPNYPASDGAALDMGGTVTGENLILLASAKGAPGTLIGALTNRGTSGVNVTIGLAGATEAIETLYVGAGATVSLGGEEGKQVAVTYTPAAPGATQEVTFFAPSLGTTAVPVPVLDGTFPEYATLVPSPTPSDQAA